MNKPDRNPMVGMFRVLALVAFGGLLAFILADRLITGQVIAGNDLYAKNMALLLLPILISSAGAFAIFKVGFDMLQRQLAERETARQQHLKDLEHSYQSVILALVAALESRDHQAQGHSRRVVGYAQAIAEKLELSADQRRDLFFGGYLHDVGKIGMNDALLRKTTGLSDDEWVEMRRHPLLGLSILEGVDFLGGALDVVLYHHERYDGQGYPHGLSGEEIPLLARVFSVADAFDAMTADRPYRKALAMNYAREIIRGEAGRQFCPRCTGAFLSLSEEELQSIRWTAERGPQMHKGEAVG